MIEILEIDKMATYTTRQTMARLKDINFIFGANGAGKTTIGRVVANKSLVRACELFDHMSASSDNAIVALVIVLSFG